MYRVEIVMGSLDEIRKVEKALELPLWEGITVNSKEYADSVACAAYDVCPWIDVDVREVAA